jgi:hypothetical protein
MTNAPMPAELAAALRNTRGDLLQTVAGLSETRIVRATDRDGWTVKHELAYLAAADHVLLALIEELRVTPGSTPITIAASEPALRRIRGQYMHITQELRLAPLREALAALGEETAGAVEAHADLLDRPVVLGGPLESAAEYASAHLQRAQEGALRVRQAIG